MDAANDTIELVYRDKKQKTSSGSADQPPVVCIHVEGTENEELRGNEAAGHSESNGKSACSRIDWDGAAERASRRDIYWVSLCMEGVVINPWAS